MSLFSLILYSTQLFANFAKAKVSARPMNPETVARHGRLRGLSNRGAELNMHARKFATIRGIANVVALNCKTF